MDNCSKTAWINSLHGGFGFETFEFGCHPCEQERARKMYFEAWVNNIPIGTILDEARKYLQSRGLGETGIASKVQEVENFYHSIKPVCKKTKAWIVYEEAVEESTNKTIISIRDSRVLPERIIEFVENYYVANYYPVKTQIHFATRPKDNPCSVIYPYPSINWKFHYGHKPGIYARIVKNLTLITNFTEDTIHWGEIDHTFPDKKA